MRLLVTGANGFVGRALCDGLRRAGHEVAAGVRRPYGLAGEVILPMLDADAAAWDAAPPSLACDAVVHLAARVHVMQEPSADPSSLYHAANATATLALARAAARAGVWRFVFLSSIKVNGEHTTAGQPFTAADAPAPQDPYGLSKWEAEQGLRTIAADTGMEVVIVRPPLVYGPGVKANFASLLRAIQRGLPLPLGAVTRNRRSLVALDNLVDLLITCTEHPAAANQTFLVSDGEDLSTASLVRRMGHALHQPARLLPVPTWLLTLAATLVGKKNVVQRLLGNLQVDIRHTRDTLDWTPPISVDEGLRRAAEGMRQR
jgi:nucleoside-diphosphate-sugar epimerase